MTYLSTTATITMADPDYDKPLFVWHSHHQGIVGSYLSFSEYRKRVQFLRESGKPANETPTRLALIKPVYDQHQAMVLWGPGPLGTTSADPMRDAAFADLHTIECGCAFYVNGEVQFESAASVRPCTHTNRSAYIVVVPDGDREFVDSRAEAASFIEEAINDGGASSDENEWEVLEAFPIGITINVTASVSL